MQRGIPDTLYIGMLAEANGSLYAGTSSGGIYRLSGGDSAWIPIELGWPVNGVSAPEGISLAQCGGYLVANLRSKGTWRAPLSETIAIRNPGSKAARGPRIDLAQGGASIRFSLAAYGPVELAIFDLSGRKIAILFKGHLPAGGHQAGLPSRGIAPGLYLVRLQAPGQSIMHRLLLD
jgi:hypothetical protein